jgi:hypothetical protein
MKLRVTKVVCYEIACDFNLASDCLDATGDEVNCVYSMDDVREGAKKEGWVVVDGKNVCPECKKVYKDWN